MRISPLLVSWLVVSNINAIETHPSRYVDYKDATTCMVCHNSPMGNTHAVDINEIMNSIHWTWDTTDPYTQKKVGKINVINNYCVAVRSNEPRCTSCHIGIGWKDESFDFSDSSKIDCLICHDGTGTYKKVPTGAGEPVDGLDYKTILTNIQKPDRNNCGTCHFYGGGGDAVKHGDLDSSMANPTRDLDVHMGSIETGGANMFCTDCHVNDHGTHNIIGSRYSKTTNYAEMCMDCHTSRLVEGESIHSLYKNNENWVVEWHTNWIACQTCHIPAFARGGLKTKMFWDWSTAGQKDEEGNPIATENYNTKKGSFIWEENVTPEYVWYNGNVEYVTLEDTFETGEVVTINKLKGDINNSTSKLFPVKAFSGIQPYDAVLGNLIVPNLFPNPSGPEDPDAYWKSYNWTKAAASGMETIGREFSGSVGFIESKMYWIQNHMVAPKEHALRCIDCHSTWGRLQFNKLGYGEERAQSLQTIYEWKVWAGYEILENSTVDTMGWMGILQIEQAPWIYVTMFDEYIYLPEEYVSADGAWTYFTSSKLMEDWIEVEGNENWYYSPTYDLNFYPQETGIPENGGWIFIANFK